LSAKAVSGEAGWTPLGVYPHKADTGFATRDRASHCGSAFSFAGPDCTLDPKINFRVRETSARDRLLYRGRWWITNMRVFALGLVLCGVAVPCVAQTVLKSEPLVLAPYEIAFVQDASCPAGKVLKVTGAIRGLHRRKACVALAAEQASLAIATP
jgi:hypothetical protein